MNSGFRISVVIPTYNRAHLIRETIGTALAQTRPAHEIIIVDDGSTDATRETVDGLDCRTSAAIRYIRQENAGPGAARNRGIREATGDWIALLDSDDLWIPDKLARQVEFLEGRPNLDFLFAHLSNFEEGDPADEPDIPDAKVNKYCQSNASHLREFFPQLLRLNFIPTSSVVFRREAGLRVGPWREDLRCAEDYDWWLRWSLLFQCGFLDRLVERRRIHTGNIIRDRILMLESLLRVLVDLAGGPVSLNPVQRAQIKAAIDRHRLDLANEFFFRKDYSAAAPHLKRINPMRLERPADALKWFCKLALTWRA
jgi:glycosyltransferase involved in cell wall biosynthesis